MYYVMSRDREAPGEREETRARESGDEVSFMGLGERKSHFYLL